MGPKEYRKQCWISEKVEERDSPVHGLGLFAKSAIAAEEVVIVWGGEFVGEAGAQKAKDTGKVIQQIAENLWDVFDYETRNDDASCNHNHSCDSNKWMLDEVTIAARRDIAPDEELTIDYALFLIDDVWVMPGECHCRSPLCRHRITGLDWQRRDLQERYGNHFSPFILTRINAYEAAG